MINERFITYFRETFFQEKKEEFERFLKAIEKPIPRTIRIEPGKEDAVKKRLEDDGWILGKTNIRNIYSLDRKTDFDPLERRIGFSVDHLLGNFYIQELAAAQPVDILANGDIHNDPFLILDMAASPGGKTTQLTEYFPNAFIIANEPTRERIPQLLQNLERMGTPNTAITLYPGQFWKKIPEVFDRILLDAPCSGEGTLYKGTDAVKHWHIKNIKEIAKLQAKLLDAALHALKVGGEMIYSTCSLNRLENEDVISLMYEKYENSFEIVFQKKYWPHIDGTGGFFVTKIKKIQSLPRKEEEILNQKNESLRISRGNIAPWKLQENITLYEHENKILAVKNEETFKPLSESVYCMRFGEVIGYRENGKFVPSSGAYRYIESSELERYTLKTEEELDIYLRGNILPSSGGDGYVLIMYDDLPLAIEKRKENMLSNTFPRDWQRK